MLYEYVEYEVVCFSELKVGAIINTSSGGCDLDSEEKMLAQLKSAEIVGAKIWCGEADQTERAFAEAARHKLEVLIVLGGDGTIRTAAEACAERGSYLIPLPGGTMNMLPRALYGDIPWEEALRNTLADPSVKALSGGRIADKQFFVAAILGAPSLWVELRQSMSEGDSVGLIESGKVGFQKMIETKAQCPISEKMNSQA